MKITLKVLMLLSLFPLLTGCYCFTRTVGVSDVRTLETARKSEGCCILAGGAANQAEVYYGVPSTDKQEVEDGLRANGNQLIDGNSFGQVGFAFRHWTSPGKFFPYRIIGLGLDYNYGQSNFNFNAPNNPEPFNFKQNNHRLFGSLNVMTFATRHFIGYASAQAGAQFQYDRLTDAHANFSKEQRTGLDYRFGYGVHYYSRLPFAIMAEGGYGGGAYARVGLVAWLF